MPGRPKVFQARPQPAQVEGDRRSARARGYTAAWDRAAAVFKRAHPLCLGCSAIGRITPTEVADHVEPHKGDLVKFWNAARWQPACRWHHDVIKQLLEGSFQRGEIKLDELWLDSAAAVRVTLAQLPADTWGGG